MKKLLFIFLILPFFAFSQNVPNTETFTLQNVYDAVYSHTPTVSANQRSCFQNAIELYFDPTYNTSSYASDSSLLRFRNYGAPVYAGFDNTGTPLLIRSNGELSVGATGVSPPNVDRPFEYVSSYKEGYSIHGDGRLREWDFTDPEIPIKNTYNLNVGTSLTCLIISNGWVITGDASGNIYMAVLISGTLGFRTITNEASGQLNDVVYYGGTYYGCTSNGEVIKYHYDTDEFDLVWDDYWEELVDASNNYENIAWLSDGTGSYMYATNAVDDNARATTTNLTTWFSYDFFAGDEEGARSTASNGSYFVYSRYDGSTNRIYSHDNDGTETSITGMTSIARLYYTNAGIFTAFASGTFWTSSNGFSTKTTVTYTHPYSDIVYFAATY